MCVLGLVSQAKAAALSLVGTKSCLRCFGEEGCDMQSHMAFSELRGPGDTGGTWAAFLSLLVGCWNVATVCWLPLDS